ncbi:MAG: hypothetical protein LBU23_13090 [Planctomycetota bacterium]|jgi:hypothetical protein|nr:hypothetical protein [Planctomycetota bacterium]
MRTSILAILLAAGLATAVRAGDIPNRLPEAKVGEWLLFQDVSGARAGEQTRFSVVDIQGEGDDKTLTMRMEKFGPDGTEEESRDIEIKLDRFASRMAALEDKAKQISRERLTVKDKEFQVVAIAWDDDDPEREIRLWISPELPIGGLVKSWSSDPEFPAAELVDYGFQP